MQNDGYRGLTPPQRPRRWPWILLGVLIPVSVYAAGLFEPPQMARRATHAAVSVLTHPGAPSPAEVWSTVFVDRDPSPGPLPGLKSPRILVKKAQRVLVLFDGDTPIRAYRMSLGFAPTSPKEKAGDGKTPEGDYYVCVKNPNSAYHLSLGLSYPNTRDADRGLEAGLITRSERDAIARAEKRKAHPPWNTALGGAIMIHGEGTLADWTLGCIAMENYHIDELFKVIPVGTPVHIDP